EALEALVPSRRWRDGNGEQWVQRASCTETTREEVTLLGLKVDAALAERQARAYPICAARERVFSELLSELLRQVCLECPERGLLLLRARDQLRLTLEARIELHRDSVALGRRLADENADELAALSRRAAALGAAVAALTANVAVLSEKEAGDGARQAAATAAADELRRREDLQALKAEQNALR
ncbi:unnamed protein product, partial [Phaeothamnion confervicola]